MDDMKRLVEKYKQELMEYKKAAKPEPQPQPLNFPEMLEEQSAAQPAAEEPHTDPQPSPEPEQPVFESRSIISEIIGEDIPEPVEEPAAECPRMSADADGDITGARQSIEQMISEERVPVPDAEENIPEEPSSPPEESDSAAGLIPDEQEHQCCDDQQENDALQDSGAEQAPGDERQAPPEEDGILVPGIDSLFDTPVGGSSPEAQLTGRSFEDESVTPNPRSDVKPLVQQTKPGHRMEEPEYASIEEFNNANQRLGTLRFRIYTARGAFPVKNAVCTITKQIGGKTYTFNTLKTDMSGQTAVVSLPAPPASLSQDPDNTVQPYALYDALIQAAGYADVIIEELPIFEGVLSVQRTSMLPLLEAGESSTITADEPDLNGGG